MSTRRSDAVSATIVALVVWSVGRADGRTPREILRPVPFLAGVAAAVGLEFGFARWPTRARRLWRLPTVRFGSPAVLAAVSLVIGRRSSAAIAATLGGLTGYALLLVGVVSGVVPDPSTWFGADRQSQLSGRDGPL